MADSTSDSNSMQEESVITKLVSSASLKSPHIETWQLSRFSDAKPKQSAEVTEEINQRVQAQIQPELKKQAELLKKAAYDAAYQEGYEAGFLSGTEDGKSQSIDLGLKEQRELFEPKLTQFDQILSLLDQPYRSIEKQVLSDLVDLALHVAKRVVRDEISYRKEWVLDAIQEAVKALPDDDPSIQVQLHPKDLETLELLQSEIITQWQIKSNPELVEGTCLVKQGHSSVLNSWLNRFNEMALDLKSKTTDSEAD